MMTMGELNEIQLKIEEVFSYNVMKVMECQNSSELHELFEILADVVISDYTQKLMNKKL